MWMGLDFTTEIAVAVLLLMPSCVSALDCSLAYLSCVCDGPRTAAKSCGATSQGARYLGRHDQSRMSVTEAMCNPLTVNIVQSAC